MAGNPHPVFVDNVPPEKAVARADIVYRLGSPDDVRGTDLSGSYAIFVSSKGSLYKKDTSNTTGLDDGNLLIRDANGVAWRKTGGSDGLDGQDGATIIFQSDEPSTDYPAGSLWIDEDSADLDLYSLEGSPLAWADTGRNLKGADGAGAVSSVNTKTGDVLIEEIIHAATGKTTPVDADELALIDSAASNVLKKLTWANLKAALPSGGGLSFNIVTDFGADSTGATSNFGAAFNAAMDAIHPLGSAGAPRGTLYIPAGTYKIGSTQPVWQSNVNIVADPSAYIQADESLSCMIDSDAADDLMYISIRGGVWDGNSNVTHGFRFKSFFQLGVFNVAMLNCNNSSGGFIGLGDNSATYLNNITIKDVMMYNWGSQTPTLVSGNCGLYTLNTNGVANSNFVNLDIVGCNRGVYGKFASSRFDKVHPWVFGDQGSMEYGIYLADFGSTLTHCEVDGPIASGKAGFRFAGSGAVYSLVGCEVFEATNDNIGYAVEIDSGALVSATSNWFHGLDSSHRLAADYHGTLTGLRNVGDRTTNVVSVHSQLPAQANNTAPAAGCIGETVSQFTNNVSMSNGTAKTVASLTPSAGVWMIWAQIDTVPAASTTTSNFQASISTTNNTEDYGNMQSVTASIPAGFVTRFLAPPQVVRANGSTVYYAVANISFAVSTMQAQATIRAVRIA